jgi:hypothetical protein
MTVSLVNDAGTTLYTDTLKKPATTVSSALEGR